MFSMKGVLAVAGDAVDEDRLMEIALETGAEDVSPPDPDYEITCVPEDFNGLKAAIEEAEIPIQSADVTLIAAAPVTPGLEEARKVMKLMEALDDHDDITSVSTNCDIPDEVLAGITEGG